MKRKFSNVPTTRERIGQVLREIVGGVLTIFGVLLIAAAIVAILIAAGFLARALGLLRF
jgi:hypothetical protein